MATLPDKQKNRPKKSIDTFGSAKKINSGHVRYPAHKSALGSLLSSYKKGVTKGVHGVERGALVSAKKILDVTEHPIREATHFKNGVKVTAEMAMGKRDKRGYTIGYKPPVGKPISQGPKTKPMFNPKAKIDRSQVDDRTTRATKAAKAKYNMSPQDSQNNLNAQRAKNRKSVRGSIHSSRAV